MWTVLKPWAHARKFTFVLSSTNPPKKIDQISNHNTARSLLVATKIIWTR